MGLSLRAARVVRERAAARLAARLDEQRRASEQAAWLHDRWLSRDRAADYLGLSVHQLRRAITRGDSPAYAKLGGDHKQAPVRFLVDHLAEYVQDPDQHLAHRAERMTQAAELVAADLLIS